ncbi:MAG: redoxin domain-containing protein [Planctomycetota bacterium]|jgi:thiol-disulfide isomerase/thioredoxin
MTSARFGLCSVLLLLVAAPASGGRFEPGTAGEFEIKTPEGKTVTLRGLLAGETTRAVVVDVTSYRCPFSQRADTALAPLVAEYAPKGVRFVAVFPNERETWEGVRAYATKTGLGHLLLRDPGGVVAREFGAGVTPTFFLFDKTGTLRYRGSLKRLQGAMDAVLAGEAVPVPKTDPVGLTIEWPPRADSSREAALVAARGPGRSGRRPRELSDTARAWLEKLIASLGSADELVRRSAAAGIKAFGSAAIPSLEKARAVAEGVVAEALDRAIRGLSRAPDRQGGRLGAAGRQVRSMLELQRRLLAKLDLTDDQKKELDRLFPTWLETEKEVVRLRKLGDRTAARRVYLELYREAKTKIDEILTPEQRKELEQLRRAERRPRRDGERRAR